MIISPPTTVERRLPWLLAAAAALAGAAAWAVFLRAGLVLSHYDAKAHLVVARRVIEPGELQPSVLRSTFRGLVGKRLCVAGREIPPDLCTTRRIIDQDEPPRLAQADRWGKACDLDEPLDGTARQRIGTKAPDIAAPHEQLT